MSEFSLNSRVVGTLRLETEASYGLRSSLVLQIVFFWKNWDNFQGQCLLKETCNCGRENSRISDISLSNCSGQYKNQRISES